MQKPFHAKGFLYNPASQQILLRQQDTGGDVSLTLFGNSSQTREDPFAVFQQTMEAALKMTVPVSSIYPVYDYAHKGADRHYIFYIETEDITPEVFPSTGNVVWLLLAKISKATVSEQTRHDIIVGGRVIRAKVEGRRKPGHRHHD